MRVIVPGGYYSYDSAGKKIWLDYQYYGTTLENIEKIKNLTRNKILYDCKRSEVLPTVGNGCITHSYQGTEADADKIQITLRTPITNSLTELTPVDGVVTLETDGKVLVLPTEDAAILPSFNQSVLNSDRLTIAESPFGGLKGSGSPDYAPGTLYTPTDGVYLTDTSGTNSTKTLTAGKLTELGLLTVDTDAHTITEEFQIVNTSLSNNPTVVDNCDSVTGWNNDIGTGTISINSGIQFSGTASAAGHATIWKAFTAKNADFLTISITSSVSCMLRLDVSKTGLSDTIQWRGTSRFSMAANTKTVFVLPVKAPAGTTYTNPTGRTGDASFCMNADFRLYCGVTGLTSGQAVTFVVDQILSDVAKTAYIELQTPDNLADSSLTLQAWDGSAYQTTGTYKLDSTYSAVGTPTSANWKLADGTKFDDCYGSGNGRALFPKGASAETKAGSTGSITYSANKGTSKRIGFRVDLPPSDGGRTNFNKIRLRTIIIYDDLNRALTTLPDLSGNDNTGTMSIVGLTADVRGNPYAMTFNGFSSYVDCGNTSSLNITGDKLTLAAWINPTVITGDNRHIIGKYGSQSYSLYVEGDTRKLKLSVKTNIATEVASSTPMSVGNWYRVVGTYDGANLNTYINGINNGTLVKTGNIVSAATNVMIGKRSSVLDDWFNGVISDARIYNRAWNQDEVTADYNNQPVSSTGLVAQWQPATVIHMGSTTHQFADSTNTSYGLQNLSKPWIALYDPAGSLINFYLFTHRPQNLSFKRDETGTIYSISLYPGAGSVYHGQIPFADLTLDTNSDTIPDCLEAAVNGSVTKFLENYTMVI